ATMDAASLSDAGTSIDAGPPDPFTALRALPGQCSVDRWCWKWPTPHGNDYIRVFSTAPDDIWLTARQGTVMQWDGSRWIFHHPPALTGQPPLEFPMAIGGNGASDMWLVYGTALEHFDGQAWTVRDQLPTGGNPNYNNIWASPEGDVWVTISNGSVKRWH